MDAKPVCRLCLGVTEVIVDIFTGGSEGKWSTEVLENHLQIKFFHDPNLPTRICRQCECYLNEFLGYKDAVKNNQLELERTYANRDPLEQGKEFDKSLNTIPSDSVVNEKCPEEAEVCEEDAEEVLEGEEWIVEEYSVPANSVSEETDDPELSARECDSPNRNTKRTRTKREKSKPRIVLEDREGLITIMRNMQLFHCAICLDVDCFNFDEHNSHFREVHKVRKYFKCCDNKYYGATPILSHMKYHLDNEAFKCAECGKCFLDECSLNTHLRRHSEADLKPFECPNCGKQFRNGKELGYHKRTHITDNDKIHKCPICSKMFIRKTQIAAHIRAVHEKVQSFICSTCGKAFNRETDLRIHYNTVHNPNRQKVRCDLCGLYVLGLSDHIKNKHRDEKLSIDLLTCKICGKAYEKRRYLNQHIKVIHNDPKVACTVCGKMLPSLRIKRHMIIHTGERPYVCYLCPYTTTNSGNLSSHMNHKHAEEYQKRKLRKYEPPEADEANFST